MTTRMSDDSDAQSEDTFEFAIECDDCGGGTFMYERFCHRCGNDRWDK